MADKALKDQIISRTHGLCTEMEGAAIAHVATVNKIPFAVIRTASDFADENADLSFEQIEKIAAKRAGYIVSEMLKSVV